MEFSATTIKSNLLKEIHTPEGRIKELESGSVPDLAAQNKGTL
jgi:hypothetical protein